MTTENNDDPKLNNDGDGKDGKPEGDPKPNDGAGKPEGGSGQPKPDKEGKPEDTRVVPEEYKLSVPKASEEDKARIEKVVDFAKSHKLTNDEAQALLERDIALEAAIIERQHVALDEAQVKWIEDTKSDGEMGGEKYDETVQLAKMAVDKLGTPLFKKLLNETKQGDHPEMVRFCSKVGRLMKDDKFELAGSAPTEKKSMAEVFYGNQNKDKKE